MNVLSYLNSLRPALPLSVERKGEKGECLTMSNAELRRFIEQKAVLLNGETDWRWDEEAPYREEKAEDMIIPWEAGQVVWDVRKGRGVVAEVYTGNLKYPVIVEFDNGGVHTYTSEGKILLDDLHRSLYFSEPKIVAETMPPKKPFVPKLKEGDKVAIFHVFSVDWEIVTVVREEEDKLYFKHSNGVKDYCSKEHICVKLLGEEIKWD